MRAMTVPPRFFALPVDAVHVLCLNIAEQRVALAAARDVLDPFEQDRTARYANPWHGPRYACARGLLRHVLSRFLNQAPADIAVSCGAYGKPLIELPQFATVRRF